jgi:tetratricopeptide (TPR) repeat protein
VIEIKPSHHEAFYNWGVCLSIVANTKEGAKAERMYQQAFEKYQKTVEIKPDFHEAYHNWRVSLLRLADTKEGAEAEELHQQALEKHQKAVEFGGNLYL